MAPRRLCLLLCSLLISFQSVAVAQQADAVARRQQAWLDGPLSGNDNNMAKMKLARITKEGDRYRVFIANQFGFTCDLDFGRDGSPSQLRDCKSSEPDWYASPSAIPLRCQINTAKHRERCEGTYRLNSAHYGDPARFTLTRRL